MIHTLFFGSQNDVGFLSTVLWVAVSFKFVTHNLPSNQQDVKLFSEEHMLKQAHSPWNSGGKPPLHNWLVKSQCEEDRNRLKCIGNIVMPRVAELGMHMLEHHARAEC